MAEITRPLDVLGQLAGKKIKVEMKAGKEIAGAIILLAFDSHLNLAVGTKSGSMLIRGDNVLTVISAEK